MKELQKMKKHNLEQKLKDIGMEIVMIGGCAVFLLGLTAVAISGSIYNLVTGNQDFIKNPEQIRIPRKLKEKIMNLSGNIEIMESKDYNGYDINNIKVDGGSETLASIIVGGEYVEGFTYPNMGWMYEVSAVFLTGERVGIDFLRDLKRDLKEDPERVYVNSGNFKLRYAEDCAHRTAVSIAKQISNISQVPFQDYSERDRPKNKN